MTEIPESVAGTDGNLSSNVDSCSVSGPGIVLINITENVSLEL